MITHLVTHGPDLSALEMHHDEVLFKFTPVYFTLSLVLLADNEEQNDANYYDLLHETLQHRSQKTFKTQEL